MNNEIFEHNIKCLMNAIVQKMERKDIITYVEEQEIQSIVEAVFYQSLDELVKENKQLQQVLQIKDNIINELKQNKRDYERENILEMKLHILNNNWNELKEYIERFLYMLNGILDRDIYEQCQLDDFTQIMDKIKELENGQINGIDNE